MNLSRSAKNLFYRATSITLIVTLAVSILYYQDFLQKIEWLSYDWRVSKTREDTRANSQVVVVLIDDASLKAMEPVAGRWPWPRWVYADLLEFFSMGGPKAILFDILFTEKQLNQEDDEKITAATANAPFVYHASRLLLDNEDELNRGLLNKPLPDVFKNKFSLQSRFGTEITGDRVGLGIPSNNNYYLPIEGLMKATPGIGSVDVNSDDDGVYRRLRLMQRYHGDYFPALSSAYFFDHMKPRNIRRNGDVLSIDHIDIPISEEGHYLLNYYDNYTTYSLSGIMASLQMIYAGQLDGLLVDPYEFENKIVFIGASAAGLEDLKNTPVDSRLPGVLLHATAASNLIENDFLRPAGRSIIFLLIAVFATLISFGTLFIKKSLVQNSIPLLLIAGYISWCFLQFSQNIVYDMVPPLLAMLLSWASSFSSLLLIEGRDKRRFKKMMSQYLSPAVLSTVVADHEEFAKAEVGSRENVSILFSDIRGFTVMSESLEAEKVVEILNYYFSKMTDAIFSTEGTIDKFIGDAIMAFWGAPIRSDQHARNSVLAALEMVKRLEGVHQWLNENKYPMVNIGVGVHTGDVILGNIGSEQKLDYTIIGDNVNLASRIEGLTKQYGCEILITESTYTELNNFIPCKKIDLVRVKGKQKPIAILQPLVHPLNASEAEINEAHKVAQLTEDAFSCYLKQDWKGATAIFNSLPESVAGRIMLERCQEYLKNPPGDDWDGVFTMTTK